MAPPNGPPLAISHAFSSLIRLLVPPFLLLCYLVLSYLTSDYTPEGSKVTKLDQILLNGNNIAVVSRLASLS